jgi:hypothetical protein
LIFNNIIIYTAAIGTSTNTMNGGDNTNRMSAGSPQGAYMDASNARIYETLLKKLSTACPQYDRYLKKEKKFVILFYYL